MPLVDPSFNSPLSEEDLNKIVSGDTGDVIHEIGHALTAAIQGANATCTFNLKNRKHETHVVSFPNKKTKKEYLDRFQILAGGAVAEEIVFGRFDYDRNYPDLNELVSSWDNSTREALASIGDPENVLDDRYVSYVRGECGRLLNASHKSLILDIYVHIKKKMKKDKEYSFRILKDGVAEHFGYHIKDMFDIKRLSPLRFRSVSTFPGQRDKSEPERAS